MTQATGRMRETRLVFREPAAAEALAGILLASPRLYKYPCRPSGGARTWEDTYYDGAYHELLRQGKTVRLRRRAEGETVWETKTLVRGRGNEWVYELTARGGPPDEPPASLTNKTPVAPVLRAKVERHERVVGDSGNDVRLGVDAVTTQPHDWVYLAFCTRIESVPDAFQASTRTLGFAYRRTLPRP